MTIAELEALVLRYCPPPPPPPIGQGRESVTEEWRSSSFRNAFKYNRRRQCPVCGKEFRRYAQQVYCSAACKQKAYRQRRKARPQ